MQKDKLVIGLASELYFFKVMCLRVLHIKKVAQYNFISVFHFLEKHYSTQFVTA